jgi:hypothetical protein
MLLDLPTNALIVSQNAWTARKSDGGKKREGEKEKKKLMTRE